MSSPKLWGPSTWKIIENLVGDKEFRQNRDDWIAELRDEIKARLTDDENKEAESNSHKSNSHK